MLEEEKDKTVTLNIMLLKAECNLNNREDYIENYTEKNIILGGNENDSYFMYKNGCSGNKPHWVNEFDEKIWTGIIKDKFSDTASEGLSMIKELSHNDKTYLFAINFGQGLIIL